MATTPPRDEVLIVVFSTDPPSLQTLEVVRSPAADEAAVLTGVLLSYLQRMPMAAEVAALLRDGSLDSGGEAVRWAALANAVLRASSVRTFVERRSAVGLVAVAFVIGSLDFDDVAARATLRRVLDASAMQVVVDRLQRDEQLDQDVWAPAGASEDYSPIPSQAFSNLNVTPSAAAFGGGLPLPPALPAAQRMRVDADTSYAQLEQKSLAAKSRSRRRIQSLMLREQPERSVEPDGEEEDSGADVIDIRVEEERGVSKQKKEASADVVVALDTEAMKRKAERERKAKEEADIDQLFADLETVVKYVGHLFFVGTRAPQRWYTVPAVAVRSLATLVFVVVVIIAVVIPTFFAVLVIRMMKVEVSKESFVKRAAIIAQETAAKHAMRIGRLFLRSLPLAAVLIVYPPVMLLSVMPTYFSGASPDQERARRWFGFGTVASYTCIVIILQIQGTTRAIVTYRESEAARLRTHTAACRVVQRWWRRVLARRRRQREREAAQREHPTSARLHVDPLQVPGVVSLSGVTLGAVAAPRASVSCFNCCGAGTIAIGDLLRNVTLYVAIAVEAFQLAALALRAVPPPPLRLKIPSFWIDTTLLPALFLNFPDPNMVSVWIAVGVVCLMVLVIVGRMLVEMRRFHAAGGAFGSQNAAAEFFHGFLGSILYGHGNPAAVPKLLCVFVSVICDLFFFTIISNLGTAMSCFTDDEKTPTNATVACWGPEHRAAATAALIAFGYFIPLSIMVAPVLAEANKKPSSGAIAVSKPYIMVLNVMKVVVVMFIVLISKLALPSILSALVLSGFTAILTATWAGRSRMLQPASSPHTNVTRASAAVGSFLCGLVAVVTYAEEELRTPYRYIVVLGCMVVCNVAVPFAAATRFSPLNPSRD